MNGRILSWAAMIGLGAYGAGTPVAIKNPAFETIDAKGVPVGWTMPANGRWKAVPGAGHNGSGGLVYEHQGTNGNWRSWPYQFVQVEEGKRYRLSANVRAEGLKCPKNRSRWQGLGIYLEWYNSKGKLTRAVSSYGVQGQSGWIRREVITPVVEPDVVKCKVMPLVNCPAVGRAVIDDVCLEAVDEPAVSGVWSSAYRNEAASGSVTFAAGLHPPKDRRVEVSFTYAAADGTRRTVRGERTADDAARLVLDASALAPGTNDVVCTLVVDGKALGSAACAFARVAALPARKVRFDAQQRVLVDGKPFLPIGVYCLEIDRTNLAEIARSPFNCVMSYRFPPTTQDLDLCREMGLMALCNVRYKLDAMYDDALGRDWLKRNVPALMKHPAVLGWYSDDESSAVIVPRLRGRCDLIRALDPDHPVWAVQDKWGALRDYMGTCDVYGVDPYPVSKKPLALVTDALRESRGQTFGVMPTWHVPQGFRWDRPGNRAPTRAEIANMTWQAIAGGANGLVTFRYHQLRERAYKDESGEKFGENWWTNIWPALQDVAREVRDKTDVILADPGEIVAGAPREIALRTWRRGETRWLLAVNPQATRVRTTFALAHPPAGARALLGAPSFFRVESHGLSLDLPPYGYLLLESTPLVTERAK